MAEIWGWMDSRSGKNVSISSCITQEQAEEQLTFWKERDAKGGRPDVHDLIPHIVVVRVR